MRLLLALLLLAIPAVAAPPSPVKLKVDQATTSALDAGKTIQSRTLTVTLTSTAKEPLDLKVKYTIYGKTAGRDKGNVTVGEGELPVALKAGGTEKVVAPTVTANPSADGKVPKIIGHGVQVLKGTEVLAETYEPANVRPLFDLPADMKKK